MHDTLSEPLCALDRVGQAMPRPSPLEKPEVCVGGGGWGEAMVRVPATGHAGIEHGSRFNGEVSALSGHGPRLLLVIRRALNWA